YAHLSPAHQAAAVAKLTAALTPTSEAARAVASAQSSPAAPPKLTRFEHAPSGRQTPAKRKYVEGRRLGEGRRGESNPGRRGPAVSYGPRKRALPSFGYPGNARRVPSCGHRVPKTSTLCHQHDARHGGSTFSRDAPTSTTDERRAVGHVIERRRP